MPKELKVGDPVLWYGWNLKVVGLTVVNGVPVAYVDDVEGREKRAGAAKELKALREQEAQEVERRVMEELGAMERRRSEALAEAATRAEAQEAIEDQFAKEEARIRGRVADEVKRELGIFQRTAELTAKAREAVVYARLRQDLLSWWEERGVWVSDGRILTEEQNEAFRKLTGSKPKPEAQRAALKVVEAMTAMGEGS